MSFDYLLVICAGAGVLMVAGGIWLIYREKILLNSVTNEPMFVELPLFGKMRTNAPSIALFVFGLVALIYPIRASNEDAKRRDEAKRLEQQTSYLTVRQQLSSYDYPVAVYAVVQSKPVPVAQEFDLALPIVPGEYKPELIYLVKNVFRNQQSIRFAGEKNGILVLQPVDLQDPKKQTQHGQKGAPQIKAEIDKKPPEYQ